MLEKEADERCSKYFRENCYNKNKWADTNDLKNMWQNGAEFGYNKANEWHYVKDELPEKEKYVLVYTNVENVYIARLVKDNYFIIKKGGFVQTSAVIAWKEIMLPKEDI